MPNLETFDGRREFLSDSVHALVVNLEKEGYAATASGGDGSYHPVVVSLSLKGESVGEVHVYFKTTMYGRVTGIWYEMIGNHTKRLNHREGQRVSSLRAAMRIIRQGFRLDTLEERITKAQRAVAEAYAHKREKLYQAARFTEKQLLAPQHAAGLAYLIAIPDRVPAADAAAIRKRAQAYTTLRDMLRDIDSEIAAAKARVSSDMRGEG